MRRKVFETFEFSARYLDEMTATTPPTSRSASNEAMYSERLRAMTNSLPQLRDLWVVGCRRLPAGVRHRLSRCRKIDLSDRDYFKVHKDDLGERHLSSARCWRRARPTPQFFAISRKRTINGRFAGVTIVSIAPEYFTEFYAKLPPPGTSRPAARRRRGAGPLSRLPARSAAAAECTVPEGGHGRNPQNGLHQRAVLGRRPHSASSPTAAGEAPDFYVRAASTSDDRRRTGS